MEMRDFVEVMKEAINDIAQQSTAVLDLEQLASRVCCLIQKAFQVSHVSLLLREEGDLVLRAHHGTLTPQIPEGGRFSTSREPWAQLTATVAATAATNGKQRRSAIGA